MGRRRTWRRDSHAELSISTSEQGVTLGIGDFRRKVANGKYELTGHAKDEMEQDGFTIADVKAAIDSGRIVGKQRHGTGPVKHVVQGRAVDGRKLRLVCRLTEPSKRLRIINVFDVNP